MRDHVGRLRGVRHVRMSRRSGSTLHLGFIYSDHDNGCPIVYRSIKGTCNPRIIFRSIGLAVGQKRGMTFMKGGNRKGSALMGYVVKMVASCRNGLAVKRGIRVNCFTRGRTRVLSRGLAMFSAVSHITAKSVHLGVHSVLNTFVFNNRTSSGGIGILSNNRHAHLTVVGLLLRPMGFLVLSRPAGRLSVHSGSILGRTVHRFSNAIVLIDRSHSFLSKLTAGICRFKNNLMGRRVKNVCSFLRGGGVRDLGRLRGKPTLSASPAKMGESDVSRRRTPSSGGLSCRTRGRLGGGVGGLRHQMTSYRRAVRRVRTTVTVLRRGVTAPRKTTGVTLCRRRRGLGRRLSHAIRR